MKMYEYTVYGGQTQDEDGKKLWPDYMSLQLPRGVQLEIIKFLATALQDEKMEVATLNFVGLLDMTGSKDQDELLAPPPEPEEPTEEVKDEKDT